MTCFSGRHSFPPQTSISHCAACCSWQRCIFLGIDVKKLKGEYWLGSSCFYVAIRISPCSRRRFFRRSMIHGHFYSLHFFPGDCHKYADKCALFETIQKMYIFEPFVSKLYLSRFGELSLAFLLMHLYDWHYAIVIETLRMKNRVTSTHTIHMVF